MFAFGIWLSWQVEPGMFFLFWWIAPALLVMAFGSWFFLKDYSLRWVAGLMTHLFYIGAGLMAALAARPELNSKHFSNYETNGAMLVRLTEPLSERKNTYRVVAEVRALADTSGIRPASGKLMLYLRKPLSDELPEYGSLLLVTGKPEPVQPPLNPGQFDFSTHLARKGVLHQLFLKDGEWHPTGQVEKNPVYALAYRARGYLVTSMKKHGLEGDEFAVASAILLGYNEMLSQELRKGYTAAGAMHVLCVSGLHVGIIFLIFSLMLGFLEHFRRGNLIRGILLLIIIWFYAFITGLSPSVMRSSLMISFLLAGQMLHRKGYALNTLAAAALLILLIEPNAVFSIGFQLSFAAVASILIFQKPIAQLLTFRNKIAAYLWEATSVAFAAQLGTTPMVLYYFNQFPFYFWLSNLFLTPLSFLIIASGMLMLLSSPLPWIPLLLAKLTSALIFAMNALIQWVESLPMAVVERLYINHYELLILSVMFLLLALLIRKQWSGVLIPLLFMGLLIIGSITHRHLQTLKQQGFVVYSVQGRTAMSFVSGSNHVFVADSALLQDEGAMAFHFQKYWNRLGLNKPLTFATGDAIRTGFLVKEGSYVVFDGQLICLCDVSKPVAGADADFLLYHGTRAARRFRPFLPDEGRVVLLDASLRKHVSDAIAAVAVAREIPVYDLNRDGAYVYQLRK